jgi:hypothetical protein
MNTEHNLTWYIDYDDFNNISLHAYSQINDDGDPFVWRVNLFLQDSEICATLSNSDAELIEGRTDTIIKSFPESDVNQILNVAKERCEEFEAEFIRCCDDAPDDAPDDAL